MLLKWRTKRAVIGVCLVIFIGVSSGCATSVPNNIDEDGIYKDQAASVTELEESTEITPPNRALDSELLEQLMIANFASYAGDWSSATTSAMSAAQLSNDYRLARMAAVLALRSRSYDEVAQASELWYELDQDSEDAYNALMIGLVGSGDVPGAMLRFDERLQQIKQSQQNLNSEQVSTEEGSTEKALAESVISSDSTEHYQPNSPIDTHIRQVSGLLVRQRNAQAAIEICEEYVNQYPQSAQILLSSSYVANYFEKNDKAEQWLTESLALRPNWDVAAQMYSSLLARQDKQAERLAYIGIYLKDNPSSVSMRIQYAVELARQEDYQAALDVMQQVVEDDKRNTDAVIYAAALALQLEQDDLAEDLYQKALELEPANENVLWSLANFAIADENYRKAERYYERIDVGDNYFRAQLQIANMRYEIRGIQSAVNFLRRLRPRTEGEFIEIALSRHYLLMQEHQYEEAFGYINDSLVYLPNSDDLVYARGLVAAELRELEIAEQDFRAIIKRNPQHANALNALGYTLADQTDRYLEAKALILQALELRPAQGHILDSLGWVLYRLEEYEEAILYLQQAYDVMPEAEVAAHLGEVYWEFDKPQEAGDIWQKAYDLDPANVVLLETLERYGQLEQYANKDVN